MLKTIARAAVPPPRVASVPREPVPAGPRDNAGGPAPANPFLRRR